MHPYESHHEPAHIEPNLPTSPSPCADTIRVIKLAHFIWSRVGSKRRDQERRIHHPWLLMTRAPCRCGSTQPGPARAHLSSILSEKEAHLRTTPSDRTAPLARVVAPSPRAPASADPRTQIAEARRRRVQGEGGNSRRRRKAFATVAVSAPRQAPLPSFLVSRIPPRARADLIVSIVRSSGIFLCYGLLHD